ncbi:MAG: glycosyltransferase family 4 protein [Ornithinimicrobium sp.]
MRIALVTDCYAPRMGGIETQVAGLADRLRGAGHDVLVITSTPGPTTVGVLRLASPVPLGAPINPWAGPALRAALGRADLVHVHLGVLAPFSHMAASAASEAGLATVVTWHSLVGCSPLTPTLRRQWRGWISQGAIPSAVSTLAAHQLGGVLTLDPPVAIMRNGIDLDRWAGTPTCGGRVQAVSAMRFTARKRPVGLLTMLARARAGLPRGRRPRLVMAGEGPLLSALRRFVATTSMRQWVDLPGRLSATQLADLYRASDLYVAPARHEAFGIAALEAAAAGLPVLAYAGSGVQDIVGCHTGLLAGSDHEMVRLLEALAGQPVRLKSMAAYRRSHPPIAHHWSTVVQDTMSLYQRAIAGT